MDQIKIGKFIAQMRKAKCLTQRQLADKLNISDKTVSKWETGKGLPEVSIMMPLCDTLDITVNDLLSGEKVTECDYKRKAEKNMMDLINENRENKKMFVLSTVCGIVTIIAVCSLVVIAAYIEMSVFLRVLVIIFAVATATAGIGVAAFLEVKAGYYECPSCKELFVPTMAAFVKGYHTLTKRRLVCPNCGKTGMCKKRIVR